MQKLGRIVSTGELKTIIAQHDTTGDGCITFEEFRSIFFDGKDIEPTEPDFPIINN